MTSSEEQVEALGRELTEVEALLTRFEQADGERAVADQAAASLAAIGGELATLAPNDTPSATLLRMRADAAGAALAHLRGDSRQAVASFDGIVAAGRGLLGGADGAGAEAADRLVAASADASTILTGLGRYAEAEKRLRQAEATAASGAVAGGVCAQAVLGMLNAWSALELRRGRSSAAYRRAEAAVELGREVGGGAMISATGNLASACLQIGDPERALVLFEQVLAAAERTAGEDRSARLGVALATTRRDPERGIQLLTEIARLAHAADDRPVLAQASLALGWAAQGSGQLDVARSWYATAAATDDPVALASSHLLAAATWAGLDPEAAERLRQEARRHARAASTDIRVVIDYLTAIDSLAEGNAESALRAALPAALVMDAWRIDLPWGLPRELWRTTVESGAPGALLELAQDLGRPELVAALAAHLCAIGAPGAPTIGLGSPPPRVLVAGQDPLADAARVAAEAYRRPIRDETRTVRAHEASPGLDLVVVSRGDTFLCWRGPAGDLRSARVPRGALDAPVAELTVASSAALAAPGESTLLRWECEVQLMRRLGRLLLPETLVADLDAVGGAGPVRLRVRVDGDLAVVPWGLLILPGSAMTRLVERADLVTLAPFGIEAAGGPAPPGPAATGGEAPKPGWPDADRSQVDRWEAGRWEADLSGEPGPLTGCAPAPTRAGEAGGVVAVLDPRVPGFARDSPLGSVLGSQLPDGPFERRMQSYRSSGRLVGEPAPDGRLFRRRDQDRAWLADALSRRPSRLLYVGHVSTVRLTDGVTTEPALHLCCSAALPGNAAALGAHRPLAASDLLEGDMGFAPRVALIGCASGNDAETRDAYGIVHSMLFKGAELVTALRWPLPTGQWYRDSDVDRRALDEDPLVSLTLAVDHAHESADPVHALAEWQRRRLCLWRRRRDLCDSPIGWGGLHTIVAAAVGVTAAGGGAFAAGREPGPDAALRLRQTASERRL